MGVIRVRAGRSDDRNRLAFGRSVVKERGPFSGDSSYCIRLYTLYLFAYTLLRNERSASQSSAPSTAYFCLGFRGNVGLPPDSV
jgi:hypothetical protein